VKKEIYVDISRRLRDAVKRKLPEKWGTNSWFLIHDNAPAHWSLLIKDFLAKNVTTLVHPAYFPHLAPADYYLFSRPKSTLKGRRFCDATNILKYATAELKRFARVSL